MISLYTAHQAIGVFKCCTTVYSPPTRNYTFDAESCNRNFCRREPRYSATLTLPAFTQLLLPQQ